MTEPGGKSVNITTFVYASYALENRTRRSHTGYVIFVKMAPIVFYSNWLSTVESSTFSSEFIAMKTCTKHIIALRFKLRIFGVDIDGTAIILNDNESAVKNSSKIESILNNKDSSITYHIVCQNVEPRVVKIGCILTADNIADALTKRLIKERRKTLFGDWTCWGD